MTVSPQSSCSKRSIKLHFKHIKMRRRNGSIKQLVSASMTVVMMTLIGAMLLKSTTSRASKVSALVLVSTVSAPLNSETNFSETIINQTNLSAANWLPIRPFATHRFRRSVLPEHSIGRIRRKRATKVDSTRIVAVSGQWIELQCPLAGELQLVSSQFGQQSATGSLGSIVWRKDGVPLNQLNPRQRINSQNGTLSISSAQSGLDEASYECALLSAAGEHQEDSAKVHRFELKLVVAPRLAPFEFPADAQVGMKVVLTCSALEGQQPISFVWLKDNQIIGGEHAAARQHASNSLNQLHQQQLADKLALSSGFDEQQQRQTQSRKQAAEYVLVLDEPQHGAAMITSSQQLNKAPLSTDNGELLPLLSDANIRVRQSDDYSILSIEKLELKHSGRYTCSAQNVAARSSHSSMLAINAPPTFTIEPKDGNLVSGQTASLDCAASGQPRPVISWLRARESANNKLWDYVPVYDNLRYTTMPNGSLLISNVTQREQGYYLCSAKNGFGPEMTKLIKITVHEPAKFVAKYRTVEVRIEERANMVCQATGEQPISIEWQDKDGNIISKNDKKFIIDNEPLDGGSSEPINSTVSRLILARSSRLDSGHYTCQANNKYGSDKMVTNLLVQDVPDKVTDLKVTNITASTISIRWQVAFSGNSPITSYLVQYQSDDPLDDLLMSTSAAGSTGSASRQSSLANQLLAAESDLLQSQLAADARPGSSAANQLQRQQHQAADKSMTAAASSSSLKAALEALNIESNLGGVDEAIDRTLVELTIQQSSTHLVVKDLNPYCVYRIRLAGINKIGLGEFSDWIRAKTEEAPPSGAALKVNAAATGPNSIKLTWNPPDRRSWNGHLVGFNIAYRPMDSSFELNKTIEWAPPTLQSLILDNHEIMVDKQRSSKTRQHENSTMAAKQRPHEPKQQANSSQPSELQPSDQLRGSSRYTLRQHLNQLLALQQQELVAHLTNLQRSTTYLVWIQSINNCGLSPQSHALNVRTLDDVPPSAPAITIQSASPNSITISWSLMSNFVSAMNQYSLFYRRAQQPSVAASGPYNQVRAAETNGQLAPGSKGLDPSQLLESAPFIERTINGQQLMMINAANNANSFDFGDQFEGNLAPQQQQEAKNPLMVSSHQHYQKFVYTLDQLDCGSVYELYMTTQNSVGKSEPSPVVTTRTLGEPPLAPSSKSNLFAKIGVNEVTLNLAAWSTGGCPLTHLTIRYKQAPVPVAASIISHSVTSNANQSQTSSLAVSWPISISLPLSVLEAINNNQPTRNHYPGPHHEHVGTSGSAPLQPSYTLRNLLPNTAYDLEIAAYNAAGHTTAQYEFVTSSVNGTRSGFSRKEGVYRLDQRGFPLEDLTDNAHGSTIEQQQAAFANQSGAIAQLIQLLLMPLCFIVILSLAFCYYRIRDSRKFNRRSSSPDSTIAGGQAGRGINCSQSSPGSIGKSTMWRINNQFNQQRNSVTLKRHHHVDDMDSPNAVHYCVRDPNQSSNPLGTSLMLKQPSTFSQSVSMKDFNLIDSASHNNSAATLNFKNRAMHRDANKTATTLRNGRLPSLDNYDDYTNFNGITSTDHNQVCSAYGVCKAQQTLPKHDQDARLLVGQRPMATSDVDNTPQASDCNPDLVQQQYHVHQHQPYTFPAQDNFQQQETSWTNYEAAQYATRHPLPATNYAIPISANNPADRASLTYGNGFEHQQLDGYGQLARPDIDRTTCGEIDVCIQQLMNQQYQEQQQQQYAMIVNVKPDKQDPNRCLYGANENFNNHQSNQINLSRIDNLATTNQSLIESTNTNQNSSSSSSSGIDSGGAHPDCASTTTGTSHSNTSNDGYQLTHPKCGILSELHSRDEQFPLKVSHNAPGEIDLKQ